MNPCFIIASALPGLIVDPSVPPASRRRQPPVHLRETLIANTHLTERHPAEQFHASLPLGHAACYSCGRSHVVDGGPRKRSPTLLDCPYSRTANTFNQFYFLEHHHVTLALKLASLVEKRILSARDQAKNSLFGPFETAIQGNGNSDSRLEARPLVKDGRFLLYTRWQFRAPFNKDFFEEFRICPHNRYTGRGMLHPKDLYSKRISEVINYASASHVELRMSCKRCPTYIMFVGSDWNKLEIRVWQDFGGIWDDNAWRMQTHEGHRQRLWLPEKGADVLKKFPTYAQNPAFGRPATSCLVRRSIVDRIFSRR